MEFMPHFIFVIHILYYVVVELCEPECIWKKTAVEPSWEIDLNRNPILYDEEQAWIKEMKMIHFILGMPFNAIEQIENMLNNLATPRNLSGNKNVINKNETVKNLILHDDYIVINSQNNSKNLTLPMQKYMIYNHVKYHKLYNERTSKATH